MASGIILNYVCPTLGSIMASVMFAAPVRDLRNALKDGSLGELNPFPWAWGLTNCLGWVVYGYYRHDPFVVAANLPGLLLYVWLNSGASRLQYLELNERRKHQLQQTPRREHWDAAVNTDEGDGLMSETERNVLEDSLVMVPQEITLLRILIAWSLVLVYVGWFSREDPGTIVGFVVNLNLIIFYGAPLQTLRRVIETGNADSIHTPTMVMNWTNTSFWIAYGIARKDIIILTPNVIGLLLGLMQGLLKALYPSRTSETIMSERVPSEEHNPEES